jgi:hypothetical protein
MSDVRQFYPPIHAEIKINAGLFLKLTEAAAEEHLAVDLFCERLLSEGLQNLQLFKTTWPPPRETR